MDFSEVTLFPISSVRQLPPQHPHQGIKQRQVESPANGSLFVNLIQLTVQRDFQTLVSLNKFK